MFSGISGIWSGFSSDAYSNVMCGEIGSLDPFKDVFFSRQVEKKHTHKIMRVYNNGKDYYENAHHKTWGRWEKMWGRRMHLRGKVNVPMKT